MNIPKMGIKVRLPSKGFFVVPPAVFNWAIMTNAVFMHLPDMASNGYEIVPAIWAFARPLTSGDVSTELHRRNTMWIG